MTIDFSFLLCYNVIMSMNNPESNAAPVDPYTMYDEEAYMLEIAEFDATLQENPESLFPPLAIPEAKTLRPEFDAELSLEKAVNSAQALLELANFQDTLIVKAIKYGEATLAMYREKISSAQHLVAPDTLIDPLVKLAYRNAEYIESMTETAPLAKPTMLDRLSTVFRR